MELKGFDEDSFRSFLLTFRLLVQDNEPTSVRDIWSLIKNHGADADLWARVNGPRWMINDFLDREKWPVPGGGEPSFREIKLTFLYGTYAHRNPIYRARLAEWRRFPDRFTLLKLHFVLALKVILESAIEIAEAIKNPSKIREDDKAVPKFDEFPDELKDRSSIRLVTAGVDDNPIALDAIRRRNSLLRELNIYLFELGKEDGKNCSSMNAGIIDEMRDPEGSILAGDAGYEGARIAVNETELDPDRTIRFAIGFLGDWRISVKVCSSILPPVIINLDADGDFLPITREIKRHHSQIFDGWPISQQEIEQKANALLSNSVEE
ncbi:MAG: hypothetical protein ACI8UO_004729 [Verrucomicrobiales bacterium]|jgi:hypothetical protein